jgi:hypothetical protein
MKNKLRLCSLMLFFVFVLQLCACSNGGNDPSSTTAGQSTTAATETTEETTTTTTVEETTIEAQKMILGNGSEQINLWSYSSEVFNFVSNYMRIHPEFSDKYKVVCYLYDSMTYQSMLNILLRKGGTDAPDIYVVECAFASDYTQGSMSEYAATYKELGIDVDAKIKDADIQQYIVDVGTRNGEVVGLTYDNSAGLMIYNYAIAKKVFGTGDPDKIEEIFGAGSGNLDKFMEASAKLKSKGYSVVSGPSEVWNMCDSSATTPWVVNGDVNLAPERENYLDVGKQLVSNGWTPNSKNWTQEWYNDMSGNKVFAYFEPAWFVNYTMQDHAKSGNWRVCTPPIGFYSGGNWILARKGTSQKEGVAELIEWMTLDTSKQGLQYSLASQKGYVTPVSSNAVMSSLKGTLKFLNNQDMFPVIINSGKCVKVSSVQKYDYTISSIFNEYASKYFDGEYDDKQRVVSSFKSAVKDRINISDV